MSELLCCNTYSTISILSQIHDFEIHEAQKRGRYQMHALNFLWIGLWNDIWSEFWIGMELIMTENHYLECAALRFCSIQCCSTLWGSTWDFSVHRVSTFFVSYTRHTSRLISFKPRPRDIQQFRSTYTSVTYLSTLMASPVSSFSNITTANVPSVNYSM